MRPSLRVLALALAAAAASTARPARADSVRCAGGIVSTGDTTLDLLGKCGPPTLAERAGEGRAAVDVRVGVAVRTTAPVEIWSYDLGRNRFTQRVRIEKGRIVSIERGGYGYADTEPVPIHPARARCEPAALAEGTLELDVLARCGDPALQEAWEEEVAVVGGGEGGPVVAAELATRTVRLLTYDFGSSQLVRLVRIEEGKVVRVETGGYGYADGP